MRIRWDYDRKKWLIWPGEIAKENEEIMLRQADLFPSYYDNWGSGDVYFYTKDFPIGVLLEFYHEKDLYLEILY